MLNLSRVHVGEGTFVVGPIYLGNVAQIFFGKNVWVGTNFFVYGNGCIDIALEVIFVTGSHEIN